MKVLVIDSQELTGTSLAAALKKSPDISKCIHVCPTKELSDILLTFQPTVIILALYFTSPELLHLGHTLCQDSQAKVVFIAKETLQEYKEQALEMGADGYLSSELSRAEFTICLKLIAFENIQLFPKGLVDWQLTTREKLLLNLIAQGEKQHTVAEELGLSEKTIRNHLYTINQKLGTKSTITAIVKAIELGIIPLNQKRLTSQG